MKYLSRKTTSFLIFGLLLYYFLVLYPFHGSYYNPVKERLSDAFHFPLFYLLTIFLFLLTPKTKPLVRVVASVMIAIAMAGYTELIQPQTGRTASAVDFFNGILGSVLAGYGLYGFCSKRSLQYYFFYFSTNVAALLLVLIPAYRAYQIQDHLRNLFPTLALFESSAELTNWNFYTYQQASKPVAQIVPSSPINSGHALYLKATSGKFVGFEYRPPTHDFSRFTTLYFDVFNPGAEFMLHLRIDAEKHQSYDRRANMVLNIKPGLNLISLPLSQIKAAPQQAPLNIRTINTIFFFLSDISTPHAFYLDNILLK